MADLIERLRDNAAPFVDGDHRIDDAHVTPGCDLCGEAADRIAALEAALAEARPMIADAVTLQWDGAKALLTTIDTLLLYAAAPAQPAGGKS